MNKLNMNGSSKETAERKLSKESAEKILSDTFKPRIELEDDPDHKRCAVCKNRAKHSYNVKIEIRIKKNHYINYTRSVCAACMDTIIKEAV